MRLVLRALFAASLLAGCHHTRKTLVPDVPTNGSATARERFAEARSKFLRDGGKGEEFKQIVEDFPQDPIVPWAQLYAGIAAVKGHNFAEADKELGKVIDGAAKPELALKARMFLGIAKNYEGDAAAARKLLAGTDQAIENDDERTEWLAAVAYATAAGERPLGALPVFDQLWDRVTPAERAVIVARLEEVIAAADPEALRHAYDDLPDRRGASIAIAGSRLALIADQSGDPARAAKLREDIAPARAAAGLPRTITAATAGPATSTTGDSGLVGAVMPGAKKDSRITEAAIAGLGLAAGAAGGTGVAAIETRAANDKAAAAEAVDQLSQQNVIAIVGPVGDGSVDAAADRAEHLGVPLLSLSPNADGRVKGRFVFHVRHSHEARARLLAERALAKGITKFAVLGPETEYGKTTIAAFVDAVQKGGGKIISTVTYPKDTKSFVDQAKRLKDGWDGVFVADEAESLGLIVPAIALTGAQPKPLPFPKKMKNARPVLLLSTAEALTSEYLKAAGHNSEGALLAPGFYPDDADPIAKPFIDRFVAAYGHAPGATAAYAYDAAQLAAAAGTGGRAGLASTLATGQLAGVTGAIRFDGDHHRADPGVIYTVVEETGGAYAIRATK